MQRLKTFIGFAVKSNSILKGLDDILRSRKKLGVILVSNDIKSNSREKIEAFCKLKYIKLINIDSEILNELNLFGVKILGITDPNLANAIINENN